MTTQLVQVLHSQIKIFLVNSNHQAHNLPLCDHVGGTDNMFSQRPPSKYWAKTGVPKHFTALSSVIAGSVELQKMGNVAQPMYPGTQAPYTIHQRMALRSGTYSFWQSLVHF